MTDEYGEMAEEEDTLCCCFDKGDNKKKESEAEWYHCALSSLTLTLIGIVVPIHIALLLCAFHSMAPHNSPHSILSFFRVLRYLRAEVVKLTSHGILFNSLQEEEIEDEVEIYW